MSDKVEQRLHDLMENAAKTADHKPDKTEGKVGAFYKSFMDDKRIEKNGASPLKERNSGGSIGEDSRGVGRNDGPT